MFKNFKNHVIIKPLRKLFFKGDLNKMFKTHNRNSTTVTKVVAHGLSGSMIPGSTSTPVVSGEIAREVIKEALSKPSEEAKKRNAQDAELLKQLRSS